MRLRGTPSKDFVSHVKGGAIRKELLPERKGVVVDIVVIARRDGGFSTV
jgi:hypothetical protein